MNAGELERLRGENSALKKLTRDRFGPGVWGLQKSSTDFTHEEVLFLFARVFKVLGFDHVKEVRTGFPDCICVREGEEVTVEFEPKLSLFRDHLAKHDLSKCNFIVCWRKDLDSYDPMTEEIKEHNIEVIELEEWYKKVAIKNPWDRVVITDEDLRCLSLGQKRILRAFIEAGKNKLTIRELENSTQLFGRSLTGPLSGFTKRKERLVRKAGNRGHREYELNAKYKGLIVKGKNEGWI
jgi:hypothetical protein